jgi:hypothetical protein
MIGVLVFVSARLAGPSCVSVRGANFARRLTTSRRYPAQVNNRWPCIPRSLQHYFLRRHFLRIPPDPSTRHIIITHSQSICRPLLLSSGLSAGFLGPKRAAIHTRFISNVPTISHNRLPGLKIRAGQCRNQDHTRQLGNSCRRRSAVRTIWSINHPIVQSPVISGPIREPAPSPSRSFRGGRGGACSRGPFGRVRRES